jgi:zinc D-Ala-D-Ala carboxypeptidase
VEDTNLPKSPEPLKNLSLGDLTSAAPDLPMAVRELPVVQSHQQRKRRLWLWGLSGASVAILSAIVLGAVLRSPTPKPAAAGITASPAQSSARSVPSSTQSSTQSAAQSNPTASPGLLGHLPYAEAPKEELTPITLEGDILMRQPAAEKFMEMQEAARAAGVELVPLSGFRSPEEQNHVFFDVQAERGQNPVTRAEVSAPPGYSEHHTGYAIDIGDSNRSDLNLQVEFETSLAYQWLKDNAATYNFELSFPKDNSQGVSYEPWHWRFVGDRKSLETFYQARGQTKP